MLSSYPGKTSTLYPFRGGRSFQGGLAGSEMAKGEELKKIAEEIKNT